MASNPNRRPTMFLMPKEFNAAFNPYKPLEFLKTAFNFIAGENPNFYRDEAALPGIIDLFNACNSKVNALPKPMDYFRGDDSVSFSLWKKPEFRFPAMGPPREFLPKLPEIRAPNEDNGLDLETYSWGQTLKHVTITIPLPPRARPSFLEKEIKEKILKVGVKGQAHLLYGELYKCVIPDECYWTLEDQKILTVVLTKHNQLDWWRCVLLGEPEIEISTIQPENVSLNDLDMESRSIVQNILNAKNKKKKSGRPTSAELQQREMQNAFREMSMEDFLRNSVNVVGESSGNAGGGFSRPILSEMSMEDFLRNSVNVVGESSDNAGGGDFSFNGGGDLTANGGGGASTSANVGGASSSASVGGGSPRANVRVRGVGITISERAGVLQ